MKRHLSRSGLRATVLGLVAIVSPTGLAAEDVRAVAHGRELGADAVGPDAAGAKIARRVESTTITDQTRPDYVQTVAESRTYDGVTVSGPHLLMEDVEIEGALDIGTRQPVVLNRVTVSAVQDVPWLVLVRPEAGPVTILWSDIGGVMRERSASPHVGVALALRGNGARVHRSRIGAAADGVQIAAKDIRITECLIADLLSRPGDHNDSIQMFEQAADVYIARNRIENPHPQTSAITVLGRDVTITGNRLAGGGWTVYGGALRNGKGGEGASGVRVADNIFSRTYFPKVGSFGPVTYWLSGPGSGNVWSDNRDEQNRPIAP